jgi:hypothetical protein
MGVPKNPNFQPLTPGLSSAIAVRCSPLGFENIIILVVDDVLLKLHIALLKKKHKSKLLQ